MQDIQDLVKRILLSLEGSQHSGGKLAFIERFHRVDTKQKLLPLTKVVDDCIAAAKSLPPSYAKPCIYIYLEALMLSSSDPLEAVNRVLQREDLALDYAVDVIENALWEGEAIREEIATILYHAARHGTLANDKGRIALASILLSVDPELFARNVDKFGIEDRSLLKTLAERLMERSLISLIKNIDKFGADDPDLIDAIASSAVENEVCAIAMIGDVDKYKIQDREKLLALLKTAARKDSVFVMRSIQKLAVDSEKDRFSIALLCAHENPHNFMGYFEQFSITTEELKIEIAKALAATSASTLITSLHRFGIKNSQALIDLARICASLEPDATREALDSLGVSFNPKLAIMQQVELFTYVHPYMLERLFEQYRVEKESLAISIYARICLSMRSRPTYCFYIPPDWRDKESIFAIFAAAALCHEELEEDSLDEIYGKCCLWAGDLLQHPMKEFFSKELESFLQEVTKKEPLSPQNLRKIALISCLCNFLSSIKKELKAVAAEGFKKLFAAAEDIVNYRSGPLAFALFYAFTKNFGSAKDINAFFEVTENKKYLVIPMLFPYGWIGNGDFKTVQEKKDAMLAITALLKIKREAFRDRQNPLLQLWLKACLALESPHSSQQINDDKFAILSWLAKSGFSDEKQLMSCLSRLIYGWQNGVITSLIAHIQGSADDILAKKIEESLKSNPLLSLASVENLIPKFFATIGACRMPGAWMIYTEALRHLQDEKVSSCWSYIVRSIVEDRLSIDRYRVAEGYAHAKKINEGFSSIWQRWQERVEAQSMVANEAFSLEGYLEDAFQSAHFIREDDSVLTTLEKYLLANTEDRKIIADGILAKDTKTLMPQESIEQLLIQALDEKKALSDLQKELERCSLESIASFSLARDLQKLLRLNTDAIFLLADTDDWQDMLLCGSEVQGCCQRVDGVANLNKCLLAYLIDGKNRMLAIKDPRSGQIIARRIFRLLWDEVKATPALFLEKVYPDNSPFTKEIEQYAIKRAADLGLSLYIPGEDPCALQSLGGPAPYEYADAAEGIEEGSVFTIASAEKIFDPIS